MSSLLNYYRDMIVLSGPLQRSIDRLEIDSYTTANMRFNRRHNGPLEVTEFLRSQIEYDADQMEELGYINDYVDNSDAEAFEIHQNREIQLSESDPHTEQELLDCILMISLREFAVEVDFDTFCNLRVRVPFGFYGYYEPDIESESSDDTLEVHLTILHNLDVAMQVVYEVREALEHEDRCCVCLDNFPNATFAGCVKEGVCCCSCANKILMRGMRCPHCRVEVSKFTVGLLYP
jgi:hypothetical protein